MMTRVEIFSVRDINILKISLKINLIKVKHSVHDVFYIVNDRRGLWHRDECIPALS